MLSSGSKLALYKLKIMYILNRINLPLTKNEITKLFLEKNYMDYFTLQQLLLDLCNSDYIEVSSKNGSDFYYLSMHGKEALEMFIDKLPTSFKKNIDLEHREVAKQIKKQRDSLSHYFKKSDNEFIVTLQVLENSNTIFSISLNLPSEEQAKKVSKNWSSNSENIYNTIIQSILKND